MRRRHKAPAVFLYTASGDKKESAVFSREGDDKEHFLPIAFTKARRWSRLLQVPRGASVVLPPQTAAGMQSAQYSKNQMSFI